MSHLPEEGLQSSCLPEEAEREQNPALRCRGEGVSWGHLLY